MTSARPARPRCAATAAAVLAICAVVAVCALVLVLAVGTGLPQAWCPHTGRPFTAGVAVATARPAHRDPCGLIAGPAKEYCERAPTARATTKRPDLAGAVRRLVPAGAGVTVRMVRRRKCATGRRRG